MYVWVHVPLLQGKCFTPGKLAQLVSFEGLCNINVREQSEQRQFSKLCILIIICVFLEDILEATTKVNRKDNLQMIRFCKNLYPAMYSCFVHSGLVSIATSPTVLVPSLVVVPLLRTLKLQAFFLTLA